MAQETIDSNTESAIHVSDTFWSEMHPTVISDASNVESYCISATI